MKMHHNSKGFTLVELMLVTVLISIVTLTFGSLIYFTFRGWQQNLAAVELQRTAYLTMREIAKEIRNSTPDQTSVTTNSNGYTISLGADTSTNTVTSRIFTIAEDAGLTFNRDGDVRTLIKPELIDEGASSFEVISANGSTQAIQITLVLDDAAAAESTVNRYIILERN